jgi:hypothetical protein
MSWREEPDYDSLTKREMNDSTLDYTTELRYMY